ncbi:MAG: hypothetical protein ACLPI9_05760 [Halobacteriota archaeon]|jgi:hypothetical protein
MMSLEEIEVDEAVATYIKKQRKDFRVTTTCSGALILPTSISPPKETDISIRVGNNTLYVSIYQARWIRRIDRRMLYYVNLNE